MKKIITFLILPIIGFSQNNCENPILDEVLQNTDINQYFQIVLAANATELQFINNCDEDISYTMFVPGNNVPNESATLLLNLPGELMDYIPYYIHTGYLSYSDLNELIGNSIEMMDNNEANINYYDGYFINQAMITIEDICACNGIIHVINDLIWAPGVINLDENKNQLKLHIEQQDDVLTLSSEGNEGLIRIVSINGEIVHIQELNNNIHLNISKYNPGNYIIIFNSNTESSTNLITIN